MRLEIRKIGTLNKSLITAMLSKIKTIYGIAILGTCFLVAISLISTASSHFNAYTTISNSIKPHTQLAQVADVTSGLVGHWTFDEGSGTTANDTSGNGNNGTLVNFPSDNSEWMPGKVGQGLSLDMVDDIINLGNATVLNNLTASTWSVWVYPRSYVGSGNAGSGFIMKGFTRYFMISSSGAIYLFIDYDGATNLSANTNINALTLNKWNNVVATWDGTNLASGIHFFVNGIELAKSSSSDGIGSIVSNTSVWTLGSISGSNRTLGGILDDVRIYNRALSSTEVQQLYSLGSNTVTPPITHSLSITTSGTGAGSINCGGSSCPTTVNDGTSITITATPNSNSTLTSWGGACSGTSLTCTLTITANTTVSATFTQNVSSTDTTPTSIPTNLTATVISSSQINLSWTASTDNVGVTGYKIYRNDIQIATTLNNYYQDTGLVQGLNYTYTVISFDDANNTSAHSAGVQMMTLTQTGSNEIIPASRITDWKQVGIPGGIPKRTVICANVKNSPYNAIGDGIEDDTNAIRSAINNCPAGQVVYLPNGKYKINTSLYTNRIVLNKGIVLRGDGPNKTVLLATPATVINLGAGSISYEGVYIDVVSGFTKDSLSLSLVDASSISSGNYLIISQDNDSSTTVVNPDGNEGTCAYCGLGRYSLNHNIYCTSNGSTSVNHPEYGICEGGKRTLGQIIKVISKNGDNITFEPKLNWNYVSTARPRIIKINNMTEYAGVEDLKIEFNTKDPNDPGIGVSVIGCANCWIKNLEIQGAPRQGISSYWSFRNEYRDNYIHDTYSITPISNHGYGILLLHYATSNLIENNIFDKMLTGMEVEMGANGNVFGYNYTNSIVYYQPNWLVYDMGSHGAHPYMNLFEGNTSKKADFDIIHGSGSHQTLFRNRIVGNEAPFVSGTDINSGRWAVTIDRNNTYMNIVGNVLGSANFDFYNMSESQCSSIKSTIYRFGFGGANCSSGYDPNVSLSTLIHGNYDYVNNNTIWNPSTSNHILPASLYLTSKPQWFNRVPFPPIGPDVSGGDADFVGHVYKIPAQLCFENQHLSSGGIFNPNACYIPNYDTTTPPLCTSFTYSPWSLCSNSLQTRTVVSSSPTSCTGGTPILTQSCTNTTSPDFNSDGLVNTIDLSLLLSYWNQANSTYDLNNDGVVNSLDYATLVGSWSL